MSNYEDEYIRLVEAIVNYGTDKEGRNGVTTSLFGAQLVVEELKMGQFPLLNGRKIHYKPVLGELAAFFRGPQYVKDFEEQGCNYWSKWANQYGELELDYGNAWIGKYKDDNQITSVINSIKNEPNGRRHLISGWVPQNIEHLSLPCCHYAYQWYVDGEYLDMLWIQRSVDTMIGLPSDVVLAAAWNIIMADLTGYKPGRLIFQLGDVHIYQEHLTPMMQYLEQWEMIRDMQCSAYQYFSVNTYADFTAVNIEVPLYSPCKHIDFLLKE